MADTQNVLFETLYNLLDNLVARTPLSNTRFRITKTLSVNSHFLCPSVCSVATRSASAGEASTKEQTEMPEHITQLARL